MQIDHTRVTTQVHSATNIHARVSHVYTSVLVKESQKPCWMCSPHMYGMLILRHRGAREAGGGQGATRIVNSDPMHTGSALPQRPTPLALPAARSNAHRISVGCTVCGPLQPRTSVKPRSSYGPRVRLSATQGCEVILQAQLRAPTKRRRCGAHPSLLVSLRAGYSGGFFRRSLSKARVANKTRRRLRSQPWFLEDQPMKKRPAHTRCSLASFCQKRLEELSSKSLATDGPSAPRYASPVCAHALGCVHMRVATRARARHQNTCVRHDHTASQSGPHGATAQAAPREDGAQRRPRSREVVVVEIVLRNDLAELGHPSGIERRRRARRGRCRRPRRC